MADQLTTASERLERLLLEALGPRHDAIQDWAVVRFAIRDAARYRWLSSRLIGADFDWNESGTSALVFEWPADVPVRAGCSENVDAGMAAHPTPGCTLCQGTGTADLPDPWGGVTGTCPDCHGTGGGK